jgi:dihydroorotase
MQILLKNVVVVSSDKRNGQQVDIFIKKGKIAKIAPELALKTDYTKGAQILEFPNAHVSIGLFDVGTQACDPGLEHRETLVSAAQAAAAGGFTGFSPFPNTQPAIQSKSEVLYLKNKAVQLPVEVQPIGALSCDCAGKDLAEMLDMHHAGAMAFSDGKRGIQDAGLLLRALQYARTFDGIVMNRPNDKSISAAGQMHEGLVSTSLGLSGLPHMAEDLMIERDLHLLDYAQSRLHLQAISTKKSVELVRKAKQEGLDVTASVALLNLCFTDAKLYDFDTNFKVMPPLREEEDRQALIEGLKDGTIDFIVSNHSPIDTEGKDLEFTAAEFGAETLESAFALSNAFLYKHLTVSQLVELWAVNPRRVLGLPIPKIEEGAPANLVIFDPAEVWAFDAQHLRSKSRNSPVLGEDLRGRIFATVYGAQLTVQ